MLKLVEPHGRFRLCAFQYLRRVIEHRRNRLRKVGLRHYPERVLLIAHLISLSGREHHGHTTLRKVPRNFYSGFSIAKPEINESKLRRPNFRKGDCACTAGRASDHLVTRQG